MIAVGASALLEVLLRTEHGGQIEARLFDPVETLHAPHIIDLEIANALRRGLLSGSLRPTRAEEALLDLADLPLRRYPHDVLLARVWALRSNFTAYDAAYVALAEGLDCPLITRDRRMSQAPGHNATVELM